MKSLLNEGGSGRHTVRPRMCYTCNKVLTTDAPGILAHAASHTDPRLLEEGEKQSADSPPTA